MTDSSMATSAFKEYLKRREADLASFHPEWDSATDEALESCPICIPPSWDLVQKYAGALDENADGFDKELYERGKVNYLGDQGEAEFLDVVRNLPLGGVLIGNIDSQHLLYGNKLSADQKEYYMLPNIITDNFKKEVGDFEIDFLFFHQSGILHFEVKQSQKTKKRAFPTRLIKSARQQIQKERSKLENLFMFFCKFLEEKGAENWKNMFCEQSVIYLSGEKAHKFRWNEQNDSCKIVAGKENLKAFLLEKYHQKQHDTNFFQSYVYRHFLVFLATYRPNFFISPVQCALTVYKNIFTHQINTVNFYSKKKNEPIVQNLSLTVKEFLQNLKFVQNTDINFGEFSKIYLTEEQMDAIGKFDGEGSFSPRRQLILGPPGSGKSLILMIKMFICGQMKQRKDRPIIYSTQNGDVRGPSHQQKLAAFMENNRSAFCREFSYRWIVDTEYMHELNADFFVDENYGIVRLRESAFLKDSGQMITVIYTRLHGDPTDPNYWRFCKPDHGFECVTQLRTVFRSSRQILRYFFDYLNPSISLDSLSGHNYDGVKVETHDFPNFESGLRFVEDRLMKLIGIEGCRETDIGLVYYPFIDGKDQNSEQIKQIEQQICQRFTNISVYDHYLYVSSLEFPVMLIVDKPPDSSRRFLLASRAICHLIVCNVITAHVERSGKLTL